MTTTSKAGEKPGIVFNWPRAYDRLLRLIWGRKEGKYRNKVLELAGLAQDQSILDVGCGTGTLAIAAKRIVAAGGLVVGVDASREMIARAKSKSAGAGVDILFKEATAQQLPFPSASFDLVVTTTVVHCLPEAQRVGCFAEMARMLKPGGRLLVIDFGGSAASRHSIFGHMHAHRRFDLKTENGRIAKTGLVEMNSGPIGFSDLHYILATNPGQSGKRLRGGSQAVEAGCPCCDGVK